MSQRGAFRIQKRLFYALILLGILLTLTLTLAACRLSAFGVSPPDDTTPDADGETGALQRAMAVTSFTGIVEVKNSGSEQFRSVVVGDPLVVGDVIRTGADGSAVLTLDDGTVMVLSANSHIQVSELAGTVETPITRLILRVGELFTLHTDTLADDASYAIETPSGVAAIRGSFMSVSYYLDSSSGEVSCLEGNCVVTFTGLDGTQQSAELVGGQFVVSERSGSSGSPALGNIIPASILQSWSTTVSLPEATDIAEEKCACQGPDLLCGGEYATVENVSYMEQKIPEGCSECQDTGGQLAAVQQSLALQIARFNELADQRGALIAELEEAQHQLGEAQQLLLELEDAEDDLCQDDPSSNACEEVEQARQQQQSYTSQFSSQVTSVQANLESLEETIEDLTQDIDTSVATLRSMSNSVRECLSVCEDASASEQTTTIEDFPYCVSQIRCGCVGENLLCSDGSTTENHPRCTAGLSLATQCSCDGPNLECDDGTVSLQDDVCLDDVTCACGSEGALVCSDGTFYPDDPSCQTVETPDCSCDGPNRICDDGSVQFNAPFCTADADRLTTASLPSDCSCDGSDLYCNNVLVGPNSLACRAPSNQSISEECECVGDDLFCDDELSEEDATSCLLPTRSPTIKLPEGCLCDGSTLKCSDGRVTFNSRYCAATITAPESCRCNGLALECTDGTRYASFPACLGERVTCSCQDGDLTCDNGQVFAGSSLCAPTPASQPDLVVSSFTNTPSEPNTGDMITFKAVIRNQGDAQAASSTTVIRVGGETFGRSYEVPVLAPGASYTISRSLTLSVAQNYIARAVVDSRNVIGEFDENNNVRQLQFTVGTERAIEGPDLVVDSITYTPETPTTEDVIAFTMVIHNAGTESAPASTARLRIGGETFGRSYEIPALGPGDIHTVSRSIELGVAQSYLVTGAVDISNAVEETSELNNQRQIGLVVSAPGEQDAGPDLVVSGITYTPRSPTTADTITFVMTVQNTGTETASASTAGLRVGGETNPRTYSVPSLAPGGTYSITRSINLSVAQNYLVTGIADVGDTVAELNESNNQQQIGLTVSAPDSTAQVPDLVVTGISFTPSNPTTSDTITFTMIVQNVGNASAGGSTAGLKIGGEAAPGQTYGVPSLAPGASYSITRRINLSVAQNYLVTGYADVGGAIAESNEGNNEASIGLTVSEGAVATPTTPPPTPTPTAPPPSGAPDLIVASISYSPGSPTTADTITFTMVIQNNGNATAGGSTAGLKIGGEAAPGQTYGVPSLGPGASHTITRSINLGAAQNYLVTGYADVDGAVAESNEGNNESSIGLTVSEPAGSPDLVVASISYSPGSPTTADTITFTMVIQNNGDATAGSSTAGLKIGGEAAPGQTYGVPSLNPGGTYSITRSVNLNVAQNYLVTGYADTGGAVAESNEGNNESSITLTVSSP